MRTWHLALLALLQLLPGTDCFSRAVLRAPQRRHQVPAAGASLAVPEGDARSALVFGWFFASPRELALVERIYKRNGFTDVVIRESPVSLLSKPRGWYRAVKSLKDPAGAEAASPADEHPLERSFDVVHVMSGGFLHLYLTLLSGIKLKFSTLVLDSTPILPKPASFTRFTRAYLESTPFKWVPRVLPEKLHLAWVKLRWAMSSFLVTVAALLQQPREAAPQLISRFARAAMVDRYAQVVDHTIATIFENRPGLKAVFMYNPKDNFLCTSDVDWTAQCAAEKFGVDVQRLEVKDDHVKTIFKAPSVLFNALATTAVSKSS